MKQTKQNNSSNNCNEESLSIIDSLESLTSTIYPASASSYQDVTGRYSIKKQQHNKNNGIHSFPFSSQKELPSYLTQEIGSPFGKVCKFYAYFIDNYPKRVHKVEIFYYLIDNTIEIIEPNIPNFGLIQGKILKRQQVPNTKPNSMNRYVSIADFLAGCEVCIFQCNYIITNCDVATLHYLQNELQISFGNPINDNEIPQIDIEVCYSPSRLPNTLLNQYKSPNTNTNTSSKLVSSLYFTEESKAFYLYDKQVLRFYGLWDTTSQLYGSRVLLSIHYYLADNKMEVIPIHERNSGLDNLGTVLLKKQKVMKPKISSYDTIDQIVLEMNEEYYQYHDLYIGQSIIINSMKILLYDADTFTREFYQSKGITLSEKLVIISNDKLSSSPIKSSSLNESSTTSTSTSNPLLLYDHPPKDGFKLQNYQGIILYFHAIFSLSNSNKIDHNRQFLISFYMEDDTIEVKEPPIRNSGHMGGQFIKRCQLMNPKTNKSYECYDFTIGNQIILNGYEFVLLDAYDSTFFFMEHHSNESHWTSCYLEHIFSKLSFKASQLIQVLLTTKDITNLEIPYSQLAKYFQLAGYEIILIGNETKDMNTLNQQEIRTICRHVDPLNKKVVKLSKLLVLIQ